ncbi:GDP-mannose 4,6-dehydratase [Rubrobacter tropicus]|uniref:GDP-mannose 4,6-dehydratase n=1 Tax=Rubrobacter tropicus TaxID=2653851 RepID=A0A6G8QCZ0_9ACTN|nr:GDP-mannose 4,6-dehydratase [Rubrobacter tropicus]QIN84370.1 GDP-mannose 4,6-dehydratase [Rubrobacter tropicus]
MTKRALIVGITGQDGSYLAELLLQRDYEVHGLVRRASGFNTDRIDHLYRDPHDPEARMFLHYGDLADGTGLRRILQQVMPDEVYNLGAQSHVKVSFEQPEYTGDVDAMGALRLLEAIRDISTLSDKEMKFYQAGTSEMFGAAPPLQSEATPFHPRSPYAAAKVYAYWATVNYREAYGLFAANGILFNHESERRGETFVTRKITRAATRIKLGLQDKLYLGNLDAKRDWGHANDYVEAMWLMLQQEEPGDYVVATGETYPVRDFVARVFGHLELDWERYVEVDPRYFRPTEVEVLQGNPTKAQTVLGWSPRVGFDELVRRMTDHDFELALQERTLKEAGHLFASRGMATL